MDDRATLPNVKIQSYEPFLVQNNVKYAPQRARPKYRNACVASTLGFIALILLGPVAINYVSTHPHEINCKTPAVRREWRTLSFQARQNYVAAVQCLSDRSSRLGLNTTRYDDFVYSHLAVADHTHNTPLSMPWHRLYTQKYEDVLRNECGYYDSLPYWDWTLDSTNPSISPVWSNEYGLGGNGSLPDNCIIDGPLAHMKPQYPTPHCLKRNFGIENMYGINYTASIVEDLITTATTYHDFRLRLERGPHRFVHIGIGGEMAEFWSSNDPIFFLHHAQIDRLWWRWQRQAENGQIRGYDNITGDGNSFELDENLPISDHDILKFNGLGDDITAGDVLSTETSILCYRYE